MLNKTNITLQVLAAMYTLIAATIKLISELKIDWTLIVFIYVSLLLIYKIVQDRRGKKFEILSKRITVDIVDDSGQTALYTDKSEILCIKNSLYDYPNYFSCCKNGDIVNVRVDKGKIGKSEIKINEDGTKRLLYASKLDRQYKVGEIVDRTLTCEFVNSFINGEHEVWAFRKNYIGRNAKIKIIFPENKPYTTFNVTKGKNSTPATEIDYLEKTLNGRLLLEFDISKADFNEKYQIKWDW